MTSDGSGAAIINFLLCVPSARVLFVSEGATSSILVKTGRVWAKTKGLGEGIQDL